MIFGANQGKSGESIANAKYLPYLAMYKAHFFTQISKGK